jgi:hypothetical protein
MSKILSVLIILLALSPLAQAGRIALISPVIDARENFEKGNIEFVAMKWQGQLLLPGIETERQEEVKNNYSINIINKNWGNTGDTDYVPGKEHQVKRYVNRYNLMMEKLIKEDEIKKSRQYRY